MEFGDSATTMHVESIIYETGDLLVFKKYIVVLWSWDIALVSINGGSYLLYAIVTTIIILMQSDESTINFFWNPCINLHENLI
jgi:hypothetical protein